MEIKWKGALPHNIEVREKGGVVYLSYPALEGLKLYVMGFLQGWVELVREFGNP